MNWLAPRRRGRSLRGIWLLAALTAAAACSVPAEDSAADTDARSYALDFELEPDPGAAAVKVTMTVSQRAHALREIRFAYDTERFEAFAGDGVLNVEDGTLRWFVPESGGSLSWRVEARRQRESGGYDAWLGPDFGLLRVERLIPRAVTRTLKGAFSRTTMRFDLPDGWSVVSQYRETDGRFVIDNPARRYDEPSGWLVMGRLGVRMDRIAGTRVVVAAPVDNAVRRLDMLAFLNWTLPEVARLAGPLPPRLTIVSAGDPMWRGGLSASDSFYVHAERPLVSENGSSTLLHEVMHVVLGLRADPGFDWIVEGFAEYYSIRTLARAGGLSPERSDKALEAQATWADDANVLCADPSTGPRTAKAVTVFTALDREIRDATNRERSLDDVLAALLAERQSTVNLDALERAVVDVLGGPAASIAPDALPGCAEHGASPTTAGTSG